MKPEHLHYQMAVKRIPELKLLRDSFVGRIIHNGFQRWAAEVIDLLQFNVSVGDDAAKWQKSIRP
ncbi:MAG TPA: hypothetical protein VEC37_13305 [Bacillota bacterium]|nr:hypothetical protein [Bacillota bacterium]